MALLEILTYPDPRLAQISKPVTDFGPELKKLCDDLLETMYEIPSLKNCRSCRVTGNTLKNKEKPIIEFDPDGEKEIA